MAKAVGLAFHNRNTTEQRLKFYAGAANLETLRTGKKTWMWFVHEKKPEGPQYNAIRPFRYRPVQYLEDHMKHFEPIAILEDVQNRLHLSTDILSTYRTAGIVDIPNIFDWWFDTTNGESLAQLATREIEMYYHHTSRFDRDPHGMVWPLQWILSTVVQRGYHWPRSYKVHSRFRSQSS